MEQLLLALAKAAIAERFGGAPIDKEAYYRGDARLRERRAVFVTLKQAGRLRGCIGSLTPHRSLLEDVIANARAAAFSDPRFRPLEADEWPQTQIELSLLSLPYAIEYRDEADLRTKVRPRVDGVILELGGRRATFLPSVWEELETFELFFAHLCAKAGLEQGCLVRHPQISLYQSQKII
ncbi:MAG: AmmeMemoRadiSam system protein A [Campylobacterales bacterium]|nr:AmmeMemoRadiSam system protein A [Campylobacterales bacterium]